MENIGHTSCRYTSWRCLYLCRYVCIYHGDVDVCVYIYIMSINHIAIYIHADIYIYLDILLCRHTHTACRYCLSLSVPRCLVCCCNLPDVYYRCERHLVSRLVCVTGCYRVLLGVTGCHLVSMFDVRQYYYLHHSVFPGQLCPTICLSPVLSHKIILTSPPSLGYVPGCLRAKRFQTVLISRASWRRA